ncbi:MAG: competence/damage-inducible protein A [Tepidisphaeraceae bacterium]|jgi:nicotinamide-nucleotide amidase
MRAIILSIGDELVLGQTIDTNSAWLSAQLAALGVAVLQHITLPDNQSAIESAIRSLAPTCDLLIINGGLGPTPDDLTRQALAAALNEPLELNQEWLDRLQTFFRRRALRMPEMNRIQAMIPRGATLLENQAGTAPGIAAILHSCRIYSMPGVPKEMKLMFEKSVAPHLKTTGPTILSRTLHTFGQGESTIAEKLGPLMDRTRNPSVGTTVSAGIVSLRITARFETPAQAARELDQTTELCAAALGPLIYGRGDETLQSVTGQLLAQKSQTVTAAESCTGGLLAKMITDIPGSSAYFQQAWITYADSAKTDLLNVPPDLLKEHGPVSEAVALAMSQSARLKSGADCALSITGIAGPDGGTHANPVGAVWIALASADSNSARRFLFPGDREMIRDRAAKTALSLLRFHLLGLRPPF